VEDLERSLRFYQSLFGFPVFFSDARMAALGVAGAQVLLLFKKGASASPLRTPGGIIPPNDGDGQLHLAFSVAGSELESWEQWLERSGVPVESRVSWERGGRSLYFRDPDQHLIELVTPGTWPIY